MTHELHEEGPEGHGVQRTGDRVGEPTHPPGVEAVRVDECLFHPEIAATGLGERCAEFRIRNGGEHRDEPVDDERERQGRAGDTGREPREGEHTRPYHRADTDKRDVEQAHVAGEFGLDGTVSRRTALRFRLGRTMVHRSHFVFQ